MSFCEHTGEEQFSGAGRRPVGTAGSTLRRGNGKPLVSYALYMEG